MEISCTGFEEGDEWKKRAPQRVTIEGGGLSNLGKGEPPDVSDDEIVKGPYIAEGLTLQEHIRVDLNEESCDGHQDVPLGQFLGFGKHLAKEGLSPFYGPRASCI